MPPGQGNLLEPRRVAINSRDALNAVGTNKLTIKEAVRALLDADRYVGHIFCVWSPTDSHYIDGKALPHIRHTRTTM